MKIEVFYNRDYGERRVAIKIIDKTTREPEKIIDISRERNGHTEIIMDAHLNFAMHKNHDIKTVRMDRLNSLCRASFC